jgi:hypothetical protein
MRIPKYVTILGEKIQIKMVDEVFVEGKRVSGSFDENTMTIEIEKGFSDNITFGLLVHEMAHSFLITTGIDQKLSEQETEVYCQLIKKFVIDCIRSFA